MKDTIYNIIVNMKCLEKNLTTYVGVIYGENIKLYWEKVKNSLVK